MPNYAETNCTRLRAVSSEGKPSEPGCGKLPRQIKISHSHIPFIRLVGGIVGADADDEKHLGDNRARRKNAVKPLGTSVYVRAHSGPQGRRP